MPDEDGGKRGWKEFGAASVFEVAHRPTLDFLQRHARAKPWSCTNSSTRSPTTGSLGCSSLLPNSHQQNEYLLCILRDNLSCQLTGHGIAFHHTVVLAQAVPWLLVSEVFASGVVEGGFC